MLSGKGRRCQFSFEAVKKNSGFEDRFWATIHQGLESDGWCTPSIQTSDTCQKVIVFCYCRHRPDSNQWPRGERLCIPLAIFLCTFLLLLGFSILQNSYCRTSLAPVDHKIRHKKFKYIYFDGYSGSFSLIFHLHSQICYIIVLPVYGTEWYIVAFKFYFLLKVF